MPRRIVGVDAGGTRTVAAVELPHAPARTFAAGGANPNAAGIDAACEIIASAIDGALAGDAAKAIAVGCAGCARGRTARAMEERLQERYPGVAIAVTDDARIALRAGVPAGDGVVLIAGTGSIAYGEFGESRVRAGGYGAAIGDEGSGHAIGAAALRALLRAMEGRAARNPMLDAVAQALGASSPGDVLAAVYEGGDTPVATVASLAPVVLRFADGGERAAAKIVQQAALDLFRLVASVMGAAGAERCETDLVFSGGLLLQNSMLSYLLETRIAAEFPHLRVVKGAQPPYAGALAIARTLGEPA